MIGILIPILLIIHVIVCILLLLIVLMQRPRSEGLGTAFGGNVADTLFGSSAGNVLTKITTGLGVAFFITTILLAYLYSHRSPAVGGSKLGRKLPGNPVPEAAAPFTTTNTLKSALVTQTPAPNVTTNKTIEVPVSHTPYKPTFDLIKRPSPPINTATNKAAK